MAETNVERRRKGAVSEIHIAEGGPDTLDAVSSAAAAIADDASVSVILLTAADGVFSTVGLSGVDAASALAGMPQPVIACIEDEASGAGLALALACDLRIAAETASFVLADIGRGRLPSLGAAQRLTRLIGRSQAAAMILLGEPIGASAAYDNGLVNEVTSPGASRERATVIAERIADQGPIAVRYAKEAIRQGLDMPLEQALRYETDLTIILQSTEDRAEGVRAFLEKRKPRFKGA